MCDDHPWKLIAPWWRWQRQLDELGRRPRQTRPVIQKYESSDPVSAFLKDPQLSLVYGAEDEVQKLTKLAGGLTAGGKRTRFSDYELQSTGVRKLFLPSHKRFYLVVCELHCDRRGLPAVGREKVCEAGMVVRRQVMSYAPQHQAEAAGLLARATEISAQISRIDRGERKRVLQKRHAFTGRGVVGAVAGAATQARSTVREALSAEARAKREALETELAGVRRELLKWKTASGAVTVTEGWLPTGFESVGSWQPVEETPAEVVEEVHPLYPLIPDPRDSTHDAAGRTLYYGMIPTGGRAVDTVGGARFDDRTRYTVRCFVRRHRCDCPRTGERNDCGGELVWSEPTEVYQLAPHFDPVGTANHPVVITLPDIPALAAMTDAKLPVQMISPPGSSMKFSAPEDGSLPEPGSGEMGAGFQICYFSIPLITIIATFVLSLFLPIVVFIFNLWFLLGLKFCIPPSISFSAGADLKLDADLNVALQAELDVAASIDIDADVEFGDALGVSLNLALTGQQLGSADLKLEGGVPTMEGSTFSVDLDSPGGKLLNGYDVKVDGEAQAQVGFSNNLLAGLNARLSGTVIAEEAGLGVGAGPEYEERVEAAVVLA